ncbi:MAG: zinc-dependent alcohol dehydrogenase, partial [Limisphaerales bacterium]
VDTGPGAKKFKPGDKVAVHPVIPCGTCVNCVRNLGHLCEQMGHLGYDRDGTHAEFFCVPEKQIRAIQKNRNFTIASLLEPVSVCIEAVKRVRLVRGETILIVGDGPFGILIARLALRCKPAQIIFVGHEEFRLRQVRGALPINAKKIKDAQKKIFAATKNVGVDAAILAVADESALDLCVQSLRARGRLGIFANISQRTPIDLMRIHAKELDVLGVCNDENLVDAALALLADKTLGLDSIITHRVPFAEWERAFDLAANHKDKALKVSLIFPK